MLDCDYPTGRQTCWLMYESFKTSDAMNFMYGYTNLQKVRWRGDHIMDEFIRVWDRVLAGVDPETKGLCK